MTRKANLYAKYLASYIPDPQWVTRRAEHATLIHNVPKLFSFTNGLGKSKITYLYVLYPTMRAPLEFDILNNSTITNLPPSLVTTKWLHDNHRFKNSRS